MTDQNNGFDAFLNRTPPRADQTLGATGKRATKPKSPRTAQIQMRTKPEIRIAIKRAAAELDITINRLLENAFFAYMKEEDKASPQIEKEIAAQSAVPSFEPCERDRAAGFDTLLEIWGDDITKEGFERLAAHENITISQLAKALLIAKLQEYEAKGIDIGFKVNRGQ